MVARAIFGWRSDNSSGAFHYYAGIAIFSSVRSEIFVDQSTPIEISSVRSGIFPTCCNRICRLYEALFLYGTLIYK